MQLYFYSLHGLADCINFIDIAQKIYHYSNGINLLTEPQAWGVVVLYLQSICTLRINTND